MRITIQSQPKLFENAVPDVSIMILLVLAFKLPSSIAPRILQDSLKNRSMGSSLEESGRISVSGEIAEDRIGSDRWRCLKALLPEPDITVFEGSRGCSAFHRLQLTGYSLLKSSNIGLCLY